MGARYIWPVIDPERVRLVLADELPHGPEAYAVQGHDRVRERFERPVFARTLSRLVRVAGGAEVLDLGCGDGLAVELLGDRLERYVGIDLSPRAARPPARVGFLHHDLREGLGAIGPRPFDLYLGSFGIASHLAPRELDRVVGEIAAHGRPGSIVALEALGRYSLEWPGLWDTEPGAARTIPYRLAELIHVHPWAPDELRHMYERAGLEWVGALDRTLQAGPKLGDGGYWPSLPRLRHAMNRLLEDDASAVPVLSEPLPPLPAHPAARVHHDLAARRRVLASDPRGAASAVWALEPHAEGGYGHGLLAVGRVR